MIKHCDFDRMEVLYFVAVGNITVTEIENMILVYL